MFILFCKFELLKNFGLWENPPLSIHLPYRQTWSLMRNFIIDLTCPCLTPIISVSSLPNCTCTFRTRPHPVCYVFISGFLFLQRPSSFSIGLLCVLLSTAVCSLVTLGSLPSFSPDPKIHQAFYQYFL